MKYSPGFEDPPDRPRLARSRTLAVAATVIGAGVLAVIFLAYQSPSLIVDLGGLMLLCAEVLRLR